METAVKITKTTLFGVDEEVTEEMWNKLLNYAKYLKWENKKKQPLIMRGKVI
jgi:hypothetical protein